MFKRDGRSLKHYVRDVANPAQLLREAKFAKQRMQRGWSDRDTWGGGEFLLETTSGVLKKLGDDKSHIDWKHWFEHNVNDSRGYKSLTEVAADIDNYLAFQQKTFMDDLDFEVKHKYVELPDGNTELTHDNTPREERLIRKAIRDSHEKEEELYRKAKNAMIFVAINFRSLWD